MQDKRLTIGLKRKATMHMPEAVEFFWLCQQQGGQQQKIIT